MEFSELVLLAASTESGDGVDPQSEEVHCVLTLEMADPDTLAGTPQILPVEEQHGVVQPRPQTQALKPSKPNIVTQPLEFLRTPFGGRLLVLESFLYKQEKAVGDKVYWKCRERGGPPPLEFLRTCYGGSFLVHQSFLYKREKAVGDKVYWTCRDHTQHGCRSRAITQGHRVTVMRGHCHAPDVEGLKARRQQERAMAELRAQPGGPGGPEDKPLQG
ncbi:hypothetical protein Celaphus_00006821, partial [Cervus elaphus hippelaphus]